ncbi:MAG: hypothetical protein ACYTGZ_19335 [Planctomycetota bacterium]|jgi:hypothetical protein
MRGIAGSADRLLRAESEFRAGAGRAPIGALAALVVAGGLIYGGAMGTFGGWRWQIVFSALKVPLLIGTCTAFCLPTFYVLHLLLGIGDEFGAAIRGILAGQATLAIALAALAPGVMFLYASTADYELAVMGNGVPFLLATLAGQWTLSRHYAPLITNNDRHVLTRNAWLFLYVFIAVQAAWVLRPFVGSPDLPVRFFREEAWDNAYVRIFRTILRLVSRMRSA